MAGGTMALTGKQKARIEAAGIEAGIREQFEKETMLRDEHEELRKFIDQGLRVPCPVLYSWGDRYAAAVRILGGE
ncbi:hypothetical protein TELCIR_21265 [Teladorsagia circumcincta]|uniref:Uncharacterized protein n=1 Tax=Teladorsagia circumcincta TaxID=45464 RepID=A0A2G9THF5_TELCI|nr:hypothetical protein TELCIR_21265 [Teladorsagia circumcincta]